MRKYILFALLGASVFAAPGKFTGGNSLRAYMDFVRRDPEVLQKLCTVSRVFQQVMNHETGTEGTEAVLLYGSKVCVDFTKPEKAQKLCDLLRQEKAQGWIKEICFTGSHNNDVRQIVALYNDSLRALGFKDYDFKNENVVLPKTLQAFWMLRCQNVPDSFYNQISFDEGLVDAFGRMNLDGHTGLKKLRLSDGFTGKDFVFPASLEELGISCCDKLDPHLQLKGCTQLKKLDAWGSTFTGKDVVFPASLEELDIMKCENLDPHLRLDCPQLKKLYATWSNFTGKDVVFPASLEELDISWCKKLASHLQLNNCTGLKKLNAYNSTFTGRDIIFPPSLEELHIGRCKNLDSHLQLKGCTQLKKLDAESSNFTGTDVVFPASLEILDLRWCKNLDPAFWDQLKKLPQLKTLSVKGTSFPGDMVLPGVQIYR